MDQTDIIIPPGGHWSAHVPKGATLKLVNTEECQAVDPLCYNANGPNRRDNVLRALAPFGLGKSYIVANLNVFLSVPVLPDGRMAIVEAHSRPGNSVEPPAERNVPMALPNYPRINNPANNVNPPPIRVVVTGNKA